MSAPLRHLLGWILSALSARADLILENLALRQQLVALHAKRPRHRRPALHELFWVRVAKTLGWMERASRCGYTQNRCWLASGRLPAVLEMALPS